MTRTAFVPRSQDLIDACRDVLERVDDLGWALLKMRHILDRPSDSSADATLQKLNSLVFAVELDPDSDSPEDLAAVSRAVGDIERLLGA